jgi:hypothetical protein
VQVQFGTASDLPIPGYWISSSAPTLATVRVDQTAGALVWRVLRADGTTGERSLGKPGDYVVAGGDFNGDGIADAATMRIVNKRFRWSVVTSFFIDEQATVRSFTFGNLGGRILFLNPEGDGDKVAVFGTLQRGRPTLRTRDVLTGAIKRYGRFPARLSREPRPRPFPVDISETDDALGFAETKGTSTVISVFNIRGSRVAQQTVKASGAVVVGDFNADLPGDEIGIGAAPSIRFFNPAEKVSTPGPAIAGTPVYSTVVLITVGPTPTPTATPTPSATPTVAATATPA